MSPQLLELLRQMAPQGFPDQSATSTSNSRPPNEQPATGDVSNGLPQSSEQLRRLSELLQQSDLSPAELREVQQLMQPSGGESTSNSPTRRGLLRRATSGRPSGLPRTEDSLQQRGNQSMNGGPGAASRNGNLISPSNSSRSNSPATDSRNAANAHSERQEMLRRAFGLDPREQSSGPEQSGSNRSSSRSSGEPRSLNGSGQTEPGGQPASVGNPGRDNARTLSSGSNSWPPTRQSNDNADQNSSRATRSPTHNPSNSTERPNPSGIDSQRSNDLSEIAQSDQPAWQKLQRIAQLARRQTGQRSATEPGEANETDTDGFSLSNGLTRKLAGVVRSAAEATAETVTELKSGRGAASRRQTQSRANQSKSRGEVQNWASSVNDWIASLPEENAAASDRAESSTIDNSARNDSPGSAVWLFGLLIGVIVWWMLRRRFESEASPASLQQGQPRSTSSDSERERLIRAFHELIHQSRCGSEPWWHHARAAQQLTRQKPRLASAIQSLAVIYEQARYSPDSDPSPEQLAAARAALKQCGQR